MKTVISSQWKNRKMNCIQPVGEIEFDADGKVELSDEHAQIMVDTYAHVTYAEREPTEQEIEKANAIEKISKIKKKDDLLALITAGEYPEAEWKELKTVDELKNYLIEKL